MAWASVVTFILTVTYINEVCYSSLRVLLDHRDQLGHKDLRVQLDHRDQLDLQDGLDLLDLQDGQDQLELVLLGPQDPVVDLSDQLDQAD